MIKRNRLGTEALWDIGATNTVISPKVVEELGLVPIGKGQAIVKMD